MKYAPDRIGLLYIYQLHLIKVSCTALGGDNLFPSFAPDCPGVYLHLHRYMKEA